ncbi:MAG: N-acetylmuramoyl-L-alanine amidase [Clostridium sp.]|nr:N-acetylmuramoyl-L-alanine amidase [Acetatifactor muris]MCM1528070.1 N-acetylmuramoyl-L-alanine amidase [Bacteroides sp.]MCM1564282.1 N-acetylmuramoyl-L-alanine amidase [Clostridium sp.]
MKRNPYLADYDTARRQSRPNTGTAARDRSDEERRRAATERRRADVRNNANEERRRAAIQAKARRRRLRRQRMMLLSAMSCGIAVVILLTVFLCLRGGTQAAEPVGARLEQESANKAPEKVIQGIEASVFERHPEWTEDFLTVNEYSRPGDALTEVNSIFVHYTANPGTSAAQNRSYFESLKDTGERSASAHFIINYDGEILQCIPLDEIAYAVRTRNADSLSIECCYWKENGEFTEETYDSLLVLLKWLTEAYDLDVDDILRHYDCGGKECPLYYVDHPDEWDRLKRDVRNL